MLDCETVRELALTLPEVEEHDHWGRPSFRVSGERGSWFMTQPGQERAIQATHY